MWVAIREYLDNLFFLAYICVRNEEVLLRVKVQRNILQEISKRKANWIGHILRIDCPLTTGY
jgi:hypothetical protein